MATRNTNGDNGKARKREGGSGGSRLIAAPVGPRRVRRPVSESPDALIEEETILADVADGATDAGEVIRVRRMHRRDIKRVWEFLKRVFRDVNQKTVELQRARSRRRFEEIYDNEGIDQLVFDIGGQIVGYAESTFEVSGADNWINWRWFEARDMRPLFVEELAVDPGFQGRGVGGFMLEQLRHIASLRGCTHLVLEVAENNVDALHFYRKRNFYKIDAAIFLAQKIDRLPELLPPRPLVPAKPRSNGGRGKAAAATRAAKTTPQPVSQTEAAVPKQRRGAKVAASDLESTAPRTKTPRARVRKTP